MYSCVIMPKLFYSIFDFDQIVTLNRVILPELSVVKINCPPPPTTVRLKTLIFFRYGVWANNLIKEGEVRLLLMLINGFSRIEK